MDLLGTFWRQIGFIGVSICGATSGSHSMYDERWITTSNLNDRLPSVIEKLQLSDHGDAIQRTEVWPDLFRRSASLRNRISSTAASKRGRSRSCSSLICSAAYWLTSPLLVFPRSTATAAKPSFLVLNESPNQIEGAWRGPGSLDCVSLNRVPGGRSFHF